MAFFPEFCSVVPKMLLHIGASYGGEAKAYASAGIRHVIWVEADPAVYKTLARNVSVYHHTCINALATDRDDDVVTFWVTSNHGMSSSIFLMRDHLRLYPNVKVTHSMQLKTSRLDTRLKLDGIKVGDIDALVIDVQGAELLALRGLGEYLHGVQTIITEFSRVPLYEGGVLHKELDAFLAEHGFILTKSSIGSEWPVGDALYVRQAKRVDWRRTADHILVTAGSKISPRAVQKSRVARYRKSIRHFKPQAKRE